VGLVLISRGVTHNLTIKGSMFTKLDK